MRKYSTLALLLSLTVVMFFSCSKNNEVEETVIDPALKAEHQAAEDFAYANSLINEVILLSFKEVMKHPDIFGLTDSEEKVEDRGACPETREIPGSPNNTLVIDFGTGCQLSNGVDPGPEIAGSMTCVSEGPYHTNANQYLNFSSITINGYEVVMNAAPGSPGIRFNNATPSNQPPYEYNFKSYITPGTTLKVINPKGEQTVIELIEAPRSFACFGVVDNDPPLEPNFLDLVDANFCVDIEKIKMTHFPAEGPIEHYVISPEDNAPLKICPTCRWFKGGRISIWGDLEQIIDYGYDPSLGNDPVEGDGCDGLTKIISVNDPNDCRFVYCP